MFPRALKTNMVISIVVLLLISMVLIDFVIVRIFQRNLIKSKISDVYLLSSNIEDTILNNLEKADVNLSSELKAQFANILSEPEFSCGLIKDKSNHLVFSGGKDCSLRDELEKITEETLTTGARKIKFIGTTWGIFWVQRKNLVLSAPILRSEQVLGGIGFTLNLEGIYQDLRFSQQIILCYLLVNTVVFTFIVFYRVSKIYLDPLRRLVKQAGEYREEDEIFFPVRKEDTELKKLSNALNVMIKRISEDKQKLRSTVESLEKTNIKLMDAQKEIIRAEKLASVGRLSSGIAHEIGNPISIIMGYLDLLKQNDITDGERKEFIERTENEIDRMDTVIRQLLDLSRPSNGAIVAVSVHEVIEDITNIAKVQPLLSEIKIELALFAENDMVMADPNQLQQVFLNIMMNAADAISSSDSKDSGNLIIKSETLIEKKADPVENHSSMLKLMYIDNGHGIAEEHLGNIFDPFYTTKEPGKGTGLGLSVCYMIVERMGGSIEASSEGEKGTTVTILLPSYDERT
jgi:signal transduction histidine kinase